MLRVLRLTIRICFYLLLVLLLGTLLYAILQGLWVYAHGTVYLPKYFLLRDASQLLQLQPLTQLKAATLYQLQLPLAIWLLGILLLIVLPHYFYRQKIALLHTQIQQLQSAPATQSEALQSDLTPIDP